MKLFEQYGDVQPLLWDDDSLSPRMTYDLTMETKPVSTRGRQRKKHMGGSSEQNDH